MKAVLLDTNIIILHLAGEVNISFIDTQFFLSTLTVFELLRYPKLSNQEEENIRSILQLCTYLPVDESIAERAAILGRTHKRGSIDLLIAATALEYGLPLITKNARDFRRIRGLTVKMSLEC